MLESDYAWYTGITDNSLAQGDFIDSCPIIIPSFSSESGKVNAEIVEYDVIIMSQSCDIQNKKIEIVLVCPIFSLQELESKSEFYKSSKGKDALVNGNINNYHLLNKSTLKGLERDFCIVDFKNIYGVPLAFLEETIKSKKNRLRLLPPYREHLSQAFARMFMRVGLPLNIDSKELKTKNV